MDELNALQVLERQLLIEYIIAEGKPEIVAKAFADARQMYFERIAEVQQGKEKEEPKD